MNRTSSQFANLQAAFNRLDNRLSRAIGIVETAQGVVPGLDPFRGMYISSDDVHRLLFREPGEPGLWSGGPAGLENLPAEHPARTFQSRFGLSDFDMDVVLLALAVEVDLRYERLYGWLHDDATRRRPSVSLALDLLCESADDRVRKRAAFAADSILFRSGILKWSDRPDIEAPLLSRTFALDEAAVRFLLGQVAADGRLDTWCRWVRPEITVASVPVPDAVRQQLQSAAILDGNCHFRGPPGCGQRHAAEALASALERSLVEADLTRLDTSAHASVKALALEANLRNAVIYLTGIDELLAAGQTTAVRSSLEILSRATVTTVVSTEAGTSLRHLLRPPVRLIAFDAPSRSACGDWWTNCLGSDSRNADRRLPEILSGRYRLNLDQIEDAVALVNGNKPQSDTAGADSCAPLDRLMAAARDVSCQHLNRLADAIEPVRRWSDIVLPEPTMIQLHELCARISTRHEVLDDWGFAARLANGTGCNTLFAGPPGTGKTLAAEIIAAELGLNLYRIDLASVVSKYIGETEKNLSRIFTAAEQSNAVLLFDEADALFGKRSAVHDSHDRYANIEVSFLLQRMEQYDGVAILASNLAQNLDDAFVRRLAFTVHFPFPTAELRERIWTGVWPAETPLAECVDCTWLAQAFKLSGGHIRNAALAAAYLAASEGGSVTLAHVRRAVRREFQKMGKALSDAELGIGSLHAVSSR